MDVPPHRLDGRVTARRSTADSSQPNHAPLIRVIVWPCGMLALRTTTAPRAYAEPPRRIAGSKGDGQTRRPDTRYVRRAQ